MVLQPAPANWRWSTVRAAKPNRFIFMRKNSFWNLSSSSTLKILLPSHHDTDREVSEDAQEKAIRQASHQSRVCCWTSRMTALKKHLTSVWIYILLRERKPHVKNLQITASQSQIWHAWLVCGIPHLLSWSLCWEVKPTHPYTYKTRISGQFSEMLCVVSCHCMGSVQLNCPVLLFKKGNYCC